MRASAWLRRVPFTMGVLLFVDFLDEFSAGMPTVGAPGLQADLGIDYPTAAFLIFTGPLLVSWLVEPPLFVLADRYPRKRFICAGLFTMAAVHLSIGFSGTFEVVAAALLLWAAASGAGVTLSQATLMDLYPAQRERLMTRWVLMGATGDLAAPLLFWVLGILAMGWREAFVVCGALLTVSAVVVLRTPIPATPASAEDDDAPSFREALRTALRQRGLLGWLFAAWLCNLMDEILVAFGALHLRDDLGADGPTRAVILACGMLGGLLGLVVLDRLLVRFAPLPLLRLASAATAVSYVAWLSVESAVASGLWLFATGLFASALYPLTKAQAYRALPGRSGLLNALGHVFTPLDLALPLLLGLLADRFGLVVALALLLAQPIGIGWVAWRSRADPGTAASLP